MFSYKYYGEMKQTMIIAQLKHENFIMNLVYEDFEGLSKCLVSTNITNIICIDYDNETTKTNKDAIKINNIFKSILAKHFEENNVVSYVIDDIFRKI